MGSTAEPNNAALCGGCRKPSSKFVELDGDQLCRSCEAVLWAAMVLWEENITAEDEVIPTLVYARKMGSKRGSSVLTPDPTIALYFRRSPLMPLTCSNTKATSGVPVGSFDRTLAALVRDGTVLKGGDGYRLAGDGSASKTGGSRAGSGIFVYCVRCKGSHPSPDKGSGQTFEGVHRRAIAP